MKRKPDRTTPSPDVPNLVAFLNNSGHEGILRDARDQLDELLQLWLEYTHQREAALKAWQKAGMDKRVPPNFPKTKLPDGCLTIREIEKRCRVILDVNGGAGYTTVVYEGIGPWTSWDHVANFFIILLRSPDARTLRGPCYCGKYFINKSKRAKIYCSQRCAAAQAARKCTRLRRQAEHRQKIDHVRKKLDEWSQRKRRGNWRDFALSGYPGISQKWLTRAINKGELSFPTQNLDEFVQKRYR